MVQWYRTPPIHPAKKTAVEAKRRYVQSLSLTGKRIKTDPSPAGEREVIARALGLPPVPGTAARLGEGPP
jgi:hypothetical protein